MERPNHSRAMNFLGAIALSMTDKMSNRIQERTGLSPALSSALIQIGMNPDETMVHLRKMIGLSQSTTSRVVDQLVEEGLVTRERGLTEDCRYVILNLTTAGQVLMNIAIEARYDVLEDAVECLNIDERDALETLLEKILPHVVQSEADSHVICRLCDYIGCPQDRCPADACFKHEIPSSPTPGVRRATP
jgi:DNA-binding MarR family transcriptional regulator